VSELVGDPRVSCLPTLQCGHIQDLDRQRGGHLASATGDRLADENSPIGTYEPLKSCEPQKAVGFTGLALAALAFKDRTRKPQTSVKVKRQNIQVSQNSATGVCVHPYGHS